MGIKKALVSLAFLFSTSPAFPDTGYKPPTLTVTDEFGTIRRRPIQEMKFSTGTFLSVSGNVATVSVTSVTLPAGSTNYLQNRPTLQSGATAYPDFLYVGTSATIYGPLTAPSMTSTYGLTASSITLPITAGSSYWLLVVGTTTPVGNYGVNLSTTLVVVGSATFQNTLDVKSSATVVDLIVQAGHGIRPSSNSGNALNISQADGTNFVTFDTTNKFVGINSTGPVNDLMIGNKGCGNRSIQLNSVGGAGQVTGGLYTGAYGVYYNSTRWISFLAPDGFEERTGGYWYWEDSDAANVTRARLNSANGDFETTGSIYLGIPSNVALTGTSQKLNVGGSVSAVFGVICSTLSVSSTTPTAYGVVVGTTAVFAAPVTLQSLLNLPSWTMAQIYAYTPTLINQLVGCLNCVNTSVCSSTGTTGAGMFSSIASKTTTCN